MKNQLKIYLKSFILIFGITLLLLNCEKEEVVQFENQQTFSKTYKVVSLENIEKLKPVISNIKKVKPIKQDEFTKDLSFLNAIENLNTDEISQYTNETGYSSYSFKFNNVEEGAINFENLQLLETTDGGYIAYILAYEPNPDWYYDNLNSDGTLNLNISTYEGEITKYSLERELIWTTKEDNKSIAKAGETSVVCTYSLVSACTYDDDCGGAECGYNVSEFCRTVVVSGGTHYEGPGSNDNSTGGGSNANDGPCNNVEGTPIVDDQPLSGTDGGCAPNNNNGASNNNTLQTFYQGLNPEQQGFLSSNPTMYNQIGDFLNNNSNSPQIQNLVSDAINNLLSYTLFNYPGKNEGLPYKWWLDNNFIVNSGNFNMPADNLNAPEEGPNVAEAFLYALFPKEAVLHIKNAATALIGAQLVADNFSDGLDGLEDGKADAFRHAYWNALDTSEIGPLITKLFTDAHEFGQNSTASTMDLYNNSIGIAIAIQNFYNITTNIIIIADDIEQAVLDGKLKYINNSNLIFTNQ